MNSDVVITTHRDLVAHAPQPLYLAKALSERGVNVELISNAPAALRRQHGSTCLRMMGPADKTRSPRLRLASVFVRTTYRLLRTRVGVCVDLNMVWPFALGFRFNRFVRVLYWLEMFYGEQGDPSSISTKLGKRALRTVLPPEALIDVVPDRLAISREVFGNPAACFVLQNVPPKSFAWRQKSKDRPEEIRFVYSGSVTGVGSEGISLMTRAVALTTQRTTLTVFPAEGKAAATYLTEIADSLGIGERIRIRDRVERDKLGEVLAEFDVGVVFYPVRPGQAVGCLVPAPNKLYEYLSSGLAILASTNATVQFVSAEGLGWNIKAKSVEDIAQFVDGLTRSEIEECCRRSAAAFQRYYNYEHQAAPVVSWICEQLGIKS